MSLTYGALFAGYGGLEIGVQSVLGGELSWYAEFDPAPSKIMAHHHPDVPNLGDVTKVDWTAVPRVDVITGGSPCQDLSHAGKRKGMRAGTRSGLWASMCDAIDIIRPRLVVWENVRGALSAEADSELEPCPGCVGDGADGPVLRALGRVLGDLAELGYDARWYGLRAADVGAPHGRFRIFLFATPADAERRGWVGWAHEPVGRPEGRVVVAGGGAQPGTLTLLPTPLQSDAGPRGGTTGYGLRDWSRSMVGGELPTRLLPTPRTSDTNGAGQHGDGGLDLRTVASLLPTPRATDGTKGGPNQRGSSGDLMFPSAVHQQDWREYEPAIRRWEHITRPAPAPTETGPKGSPRLSPRFVEWMQGLPEGHVTDPAIGISRNDQLKALGNGVVPQQAAAATLAFVEDEAREAAA